MYFEIFDKGNLTCIKKSLPTSQGFTTRKSLSLDNFLGNIYCGAVTPSPNKVNNSCGYQFKLKLPGLEKKTRDRLGSRLTVSLSGARELNVAWLECVWFLDDRARNYSDSPRDCLLEVFKFEFTSRCTQTNADRSLRRRVLTY